MTKAKWIFVVLAALAFSSLIVGSAWLIARNNLSVSATEVARIQGESIVHLIQTTRAWNANHGGVYVIQTPDTPPNPYLELYDRDITDSLGRNLTKVNPAYMTRQISELLMGSDVEARLTSIKPLNPSNLADQWETEMLMKFRHGLREPIVSFQADNYRYIAPLYIQEGCLQCHQKYGYKLGDLRGGLSVSFPSKQISGIVERLTVQYENIYLAAFGIIFILILALYAMINFFQIRQRESEEKEKWLQYHADHDGLTDILNHRAIIEQARYEFKRSVRERTDLSILMLDLDHFKKVNDSFGHQTGDQVLVNVVDHIRLHLREIDLLGRYGGEEFMVILPGVQRKDAILVANRIRKSVEDAVIDITGSKSELLVSVTLSVGVAERHQKEIEGVESLISAADKALYMAKNDGRNQVVSHSST